MNTSDSHEPKTEDDGSAETLGAPADGSESGSTELEEGSTDGAISPSSNDTAAESIDGPLLGSPDANTRSEEAEEGHNDPHVTSNNETEALTNTSDLPCAATNGPASISPPEYPTETNPKSNTDSGTRLDRSEEKAEEAPRTGVERFGASVLAKPPASRPFTTRPRPFDTAKHDRLHRRPARRLCYGNCCKCWKNYRHHTSRCWCWFHCRRN